MHYLFVICGVFSALFFMILLSKAEKQPEHWFLGTIFFLITINCLFVFSFARSETLYYYPLFSELNYAIPLLYGPLLWFYTLALTTKDFKFSKWDYIHFIPFLIFFILIIIPLYTNFNLPATSQLGYPLVKLVQAPFYLFSVIFLLRKYRQQLNEEYSYELELNLFWLTWITIGATVLWLIGSISFIYNLFNEQDKILLYDYYTLSFLAFYLFILAFVAMRKTDLFYKANKALVPQKVIITDKKETKISATTNDSEDLKKLITLMDSEKPYLDPVLTLNKLAKLSEIPGYRITRILNDSLGKNFYDFINKYRVDEVKRLLNEGQAENLSMLGIATESGFNSKASFNRTFKKMTNQTPSQYLKNIE